MMVQSSVDLKYVVVHLDLKGSPPKLEYLESLLPVLRDYGVNGLLMEYEDMFPYEGKIVNISSRNCYERNELKKFLQKSVHLGIEIIPLIQTFGHMEHALKLKELRNLRESVKFPDSICPSKAGSIRLIKEMLTQVIKFHTSIIPLKHIHVGCDEVYHINKCSQCQRKNITIMDLFYKHIHTVGSTIKNLSPQTTVLFWDDMLRKSQDLQPSSVDIANFEPVYWDYKEHLSVTHENLLNYHKKFKNIWIASAFKGADGLAATTPIIKKRFMNHLAWLNFILDYKFEGENQVYHFTGIILTGWSRYSHMDPMCELLPAAIPSLIINLLLIQALKNGVVLNDAETLDSNEFFSKYLQAEFNKVFKCQNMTNFDDIDTAVCSFENDEIYKKLKLYDKMDNKIKTQLTNNKTMVTSIKYYSEIGFININNVKPFTKWCNDNLKSLYNFEAKFRNVMSKFYDNYVVDEYMASKTYDTVTNLRDTIKMLKPYLQSRTWERRSAQNIIPMTEVEKEILNKKYKN